MFDNILPQFNIKVRFADPNHAIEIEQAISNKTKAVFIETIGNPVLDFTDIEAVSKIARKHHIPLIVDSTFTTPYLLHP